MENNIEVVVLAAGESKRFGSPKQLALWRGLPLLQRAVSLAQSCHVNPWVVLGAHNEKILNSEYLNLEFCPLVIVNDWRLGLSNSIKIALKTIQEQGKGREGVIFLLADQPTVSTVDLQKMMAVIQQDKTKIVCSEYKGSVGIPAYFPSRYFNELMNLEGDKGAQQVILKNVHTKVQLSRPIIDIDTLEDLEYWGKADYPKHV